jgi:signal transduction histidine kinase
MIAFQRGDGRKLMLHAGPDPMPDIVYEMGTGGFFSLIGDAIGTLLANENRVLRVWGQSSMEPVAEVEVLFDEAPMREEMIAWGNRILWLSLVISLFTACLVFLSLQWLMVRPMRRLTESVTRFRLNPERADNLLETTDRSDELGLAQNALAEMQDTLRAALRQKDRLAALGGAVNKINHDLRNMLTTAQLVSDHLTQSDDPIVKRDAPRLMQAIDRAVRLCSDTLRFTSETRARLKRSRFELARLIAEVADSLALPEGADPAAALVWEPEAQVPMLEADYDQLFRAFANLATNSLEAGATRVTVSARLRHGRHEPRLQILVRDNGPGLPPRAREHLFEPFAASTRPGGTGLGLAIVRDVMRAHGGDVKLMESTAQGTVFALVLPARALAPDAAERGAA